MSRICLGALILGVLVIAGGSSAIAMRASGGPEAFLRPREPTDALPGSFLVIAKRRAVASRRIDTYKDRRGREVRLYLVKVIAPALGHGMCLELITGSAAGGTCFAPSVARSLASSGRVIAIQGRLFGGVASNNVERVVVSAGGRRLNVHLTADKGFIYECGDARGCAATHGVDAVDAYGSDGRLLSQESWH